MKRLLAAAILITLFCTGCGIQPAPQRALTKMLNALSDGNISKAQRYTVQSFSEEYATRKAKKLYKAMFRSLEYVVVKTSTEKETAEVLVSITMIDMESLVADSSLSLLKQDIKGGWPDKKLYTLLKEKIKSKEVEYVTSTVTAYLVYQDSSWMIDMTKSTKFADAITGGLGELIGF